LHWLYELYNRSAGQNIIAGNKAVTQLIESRKAADANWERMSALAVELGDLDLHEIRKTIDILTERNPDKKFADEEDFLIQNGLMLNGNLTSESVKAELLKIYSVIKENPSAKVSDIQNYINKSDATVERYLKILKNNRLISFVGSRNNKIGGYKIIDVANDHLVLKTPF
jgi:predicted HTH transcriptional regulator